MIYIQNYINGEFVGTDETIEDINPANGEIIAHSPKSSSKNIESAVESADLARHSWSKLSLEDFQCYSGIHEIDFNKFDINTTISLNGNNACGKSTWIRALDFVIWGAIKVKRDIYFNNQNKKNCKCILDYQHDNKSYRIINFRQRS